MTIKIALILVILGEESVCHDLDTPYAHVEITNNG